MSSRQALELLHRYYAAFNAAEDEAMLALLSEAVDHDINQAARESGKTAFRAFLGRMRGCYHEQLVDLVFCASEDGRFAAAEYLVVGSYVRTDSGLPEATGQTYRLSGGAFFAIEDGVITRVTNYYNLQDWLRQVGASAP